MTDTDFLALYEFTKKSRLKMIFDLNALLRNPNGSWDSSNAKEIIDFAKGHDMEVDWQMGNGEGIFGFRNLVSANTRKTLRRKIHVIAFIFCIN